MQQLVEDLPFTLLVWQGGIEPYNGPVQIAVDVHHGPLIVFIRRRIGHAEPPLTEPQPNLPLGEQLSVCEGAHATTHSLAQRHPPWR